LAGIFAGSPPLPAWNKPIQWPSGSSKWPNVGPLGVFRTHQAGAAELLDPLERGLDVVDLDVERDAVLPRFHVAEDATADADTTLGVVVRVRDHAVAHRVVGVDLPAEQRGVERHQLGPVLRHDLEMHNCVAHDRRPFVTGWSPHRSRRHRYDDFIARGMGALTVI